MTFRSDRIIAQVSANFVIRCPEIYTLYYYVLGDNKKAVTSYEKVNPAFMNNREATQYYYYYALSLRNLGKTAEASVLLNNIVEIANKLPVKQKAQELL